MSMNCDMCRKEIVKGVKAVALKDGEKHICEQCIKTCSEIVKDVSTEKVTYMNKYIEEREEKNGTRA